MRSDQLYLRLIFFINSLLDTNLIDFQDLQSQLLRHSFSSNLEAERVTLCFLFFSSTEALYRSYGRWLSNHQAQPSKCQTSELCRTERAEHVRTEPEQNRTSEMRVLSQIRMRNVNPVDPDYHPNLTASSVARVLATFLLILVKIGWVVSA